MPDSHQNFKDVQYQFTAHIRDPENNPAPEGIEDRRMEIYRGLLYRNIEGFVSNGFPIIRKMYSDEDWHKMIRDFICNHQSHSPYFKEIALEFINYLTEEREPQAEDPIFLNELAHYEYLEIFLRFADAEINWDSIDKDGDLMNGKVVLSPFMQLNRYQYPVHNIPVLKEIESPPEVPTFLLVYRDQNDEVGFMEVNPMTARLIELISEHSELTGKEILLQLAREIPDLNENVVLHGGHTTYTELKQKDIILGAAA
ncbi:MAG: putative DNA-binding domain-containing protein [Pseudomonadota bacterium]